MASPEDQNFDGLAEQFAERIYGSGKGELRERILWQQMRDAIPELAGGAPLQTLDTGAGLGQMTARLLAAGHPVVYNDISPEMLARARDALGEPAGLSYLPGSLQSVAESHAGRFDLVVCHAVLEWLAEPQQAVRLLRGLLRPGGVLSLAFYNRHALALTQMHHGNIANLLPGSKPRPARRRGFTPPTPCDPDEVLDWVGTAGMTVRGSFGVRVVYDWLPREVRESADTEQLLAVEQRYAGLHPFKYLGRYFHIVAAVSG